MLVFILYNVSITDFADFLLSAKITPLPWVTFLEFNYDRGSSQKLYLIIHIVWVDGKNGFLVQVFLFWTSFAR